MIIDRIDNAKIYYPLSKRIEAAFEALKKIDCNTTAGRVVVDGDDVYINVNEISASPLEGRQFEAHRDYIDIHYILCGEETMEYEGIDRLNVTKEYDAAGDYELLNGEGMKITVKKGDFYLVYPFDGHKPNGSDVENYKFKKAVAKVRV